MSGITPEGLGFRGSGAQLRVQGFGRAVKGSKIKVQGANLVWLSLVVSPLLVDRGGRERKRCRGCTQP